MSKREYPDCPRVGVGAVVIRDDAVLLVKRGISPAKGMWAIPGGNLKLGETLQEAAEREIMEETGVRIKAKLPPHFTFELIERDEEDKIRFHYVIVDLLADYIDGEPHGADDAVDARWVRMKDLDDIPVSENTLNILKTVHCR
jgi:ADP-ribose pyrophosphatase